MKHQKGMVREHIMSVRKRKCGIRKSKRRKRYKKQQMDWDDIVEGQNSTFIIDPAETKLVLSCCDCGSTHTYSMKVRKDGKIQFKVKKNWEETCTLRENEYFKYKRRSGY